VKFLILRIISLMGSQMLQKETSKTQHFDYSTNLQLGMGIR